MAIANNRKEAASDKEIVDDSVPILIHLDFPIDSFHA